MKAYFDIESLISSGNILNELDYERALIADRKLRLLAKSDKKVSVVRMKLRDLIEEYERSIWSDEDNISDEKIIESDEAVRIAERERLFFSNRKQEIRKKLKELDLTQENLGFILGHKSKTHMSELMNGFKPFTMKDLVIINRLLRIEMTLLVPRFLSIEDQNRVKKAMETLKKPYVEFTSDDLVSN
ncbi:transcriptional regulator [Myroides marinus]|nr:transcriptional regulator [Myroides marinus]MDM1351009.1 transcriptional regulator [Myroides marinus]MDM1355323.1 transcriptional regulator [Myroides marinus]MDM1358235.1 transcriptional regulator [Myroides marinus]MDM1362102.1 transcriptional regulator [Myroides marinus]